MAGGTEVCAPNTGVFAGWLGRIPERRVKVCDPVEPGAYLVQAVQSLEDTAVVALVADKMATLRLFVTSEYSTHEKIPPAKAYFYANGEELGSIDIPANEEPIPTDIDEGWSELSGNVDISADFIRPGLEMYIQVDPEGTLDEELGVAKRIPEEDYIEYRVYQLALFELTVIPFLWEDDPDSAILDYVADMAEDEEENARLHATFDLLPMDRLEVDAYKATESSSNHARDLLGETNTIRLSDGGDGYYQGQMSGTVTGAAGIAWLNHKASFSIPQGVTIAHELGHNLNLRHAPCNDAPDPDPNFPQEDGSIGNYGWSFRTDAVRDKDDYYDVMGYCGPNWISGYYFDKAARYRRARGSMYMPPSLSQVRSLLLWGGRGRGGEAIPEAVLRDGIDSGAAALRRRPPAGRRSRGRDGPLRAELRHAGGSRPAGHGVGLHLRAAGRGGVGGDAREDNAGGTGRRGYARPGIGRRDDDRSRREGRPDPRILGRVARVRARAAPAGAAPE